MADIAPAVGVAYALKEHVGYDATVAADPTHPRHPASAHGDVHMGMYPLLAGMVGTVVGVSPVGEYGAGPVDEETFILQFDHVTYDFRDPENPRVIPGAGVRRAAFNAEQLATMFTPV